MSIFKDRKFLNKKEIKKSLRLVKIFNLANKIVLYLAIFFNAVMFFMMMNEISPFMILFVIDMYFLLMVLKGRKFQIE